MTDNEKIQLLVGALSALAAAVEDAMETPEEAASWARSGDMHGYLDNAFAALKKVRSRGVD